MRIISRRFADAAFSRLPHMAVADKMLG